MRQIVLDTETTGLELADGHRIIEIGCVELMHRRLTGRNWHRYLRPGRDVDPGALAVHGITNEFLSTQPTFAEIAEEFLAFVDGAELVIHNAEFDVGFLNAELRAAGFPQVIAERCRVFDTLTWRVACIRARGTASTPSASDTTSTTRAGTCTEPCSTQGS